jgi:crotonobetainyl-CoA:carnitine CoA-transferase CaiB-like acyl-CoA transferase
MKPDRPSVEGALAGVRVLDFSAMIAGPYCTSLLAGAGAEVIKLEPPEGDYMRSREPVKDGFGLYFAVNNAGKKSVALDLKNAAAAALVRELIDRSDVVVENFRPGVMKRLGFDAATLRGANPRLVYCSISGYGQEGAHASLPAYAPIVQAASGYDLANLGYQNGIERPLNTGIFAADYLTGVHAFGAICAALVRRARTGAGDTIDCALMDSMLGMLGYEVAEAQAPVSQPRPLYQATRAKDGFIALAPVTQANFEAMARAAGHPEWTSDARFASSQARVANWNALMAELDRWAADKSASDCEAVMAAGGVPCGRYCTVREVMDSPYAAERGLFVEARAGQASFRVPNPPYKMAGAGARPRVPLLGEDGREVLQRVLGRTPDEIAKLEKEGVLCRAN